MKTTLLFLLAALCASASSVQLSWTDTLNPPTTQYNVYRASGACAGSPTFAKLNPAPIAPKTYNDPDLAAGTYCYRVTATDGTLESAPSSSAGAVIPAPPSAPSGLSVTVTVTVTVP